MQLLHIAAFVSGELHRIDAPIARAALFVGALDAQLHRPKRPWGRSSPLIGRLGKQLELVHRKRFLAVGRAQTICAGIAAADDHNAFAGGQDRL